MMEFIKFILIIVFVAGFIYKFLIILKSEKVKAKKRKKAGLQVQSILRECENYKTEISKEQSEMMHGKVYNKLIESIQECKDILEQDEEDYIVDDIAEFIEEFDELVINIKQEIIRNEEKRLKRQNTIKKEKKDRPQELRALVDLVKNHQLYYSDKEKDIEGLDVYIKNEDFDLAMLSAKNILEKLGNLEKAKMDKLKRMGYREK